MNMNWYKFKVACRRVNNFFNQMTPLVCSAVGLLVFRWSLILLRIAHTAAGSDAFGAYVFGTLGLVLSVCILLGSVILATRMLYKKRH